MARCTRRHVLGGLAAISTITVAIPARAAAKPVMLTPESFGATGDGTTEDGEAFVKLVLHVNALPSAQNVTIKCTGRYVITGVTLPQELAAAKRGICSGIPTITKDHVWIEATGATFSVAPTFMWRRVVKGGSDEDNFAQGFRVTGDNFKMTGGVLDGRLTERPVHRGPRASGFGGREFGLAMHGQGWSISDVVSRDWGTDSLYVTTPGSVHRSTFELGRRNSVSVVAEAPMTKADPVTFTNCRFLKASQFPPQIWNAPGSGLHIESREPGVVVARSCEFRGNRKNSIRLSGGARNCMFEDCTVDTDVEFRKAGDGQLGGHVFRNVTFLNGAHVPALFGKRTNAPIYFENCTFSGVQDFAIVQMENKGEYNPGIHIINCKAPGSRGFKLPYGTGHVLSGNTH